MLERRVFQIQKHLLQDNLALLAHRPQSPTQEYSFVHCTDKIVDQCAAGRKKVGAGTTYVFPLYLYENNQKTPNLKKDFIKDIEIRLKLKFTDKGSGNLNSTFGPEDIFYYIYAILHSQKYRNRYSEFLKIEYPKIPFTENKKLFKHLIKCGKYLVSLHLLKVPSLKKLITKFPVKGSNIVEKDYPKYVESSKRIYINQNQYFEKVSEDIWNFEIGGYYCCATWLKHRKKHKLTFDEITTYQIIIKSLNETIKVMKEIDKKIVNWPLSKKSKYIPQQKLSFP